MSLLKLGILIAVVVAVLPADREQQAALYDKAATAVRWTATFCDRNGTTCDQAGVIWLAFVEKAKFGAAMAYELVTKDSEGAAANAQAVRYNVIEPGVDLTPRGTLRAEDLEPVWRGATPAQPNGGRI